MQLDGVSSPIDLYENTLSLIESASQSSKNFIPESLENLAKNIQINFEAFKSECEYGRGDLKNYYKIQNKIVELDKLFDEKQATIHRLAINIIDSPPKIVHLRVPPPTPTATSSHSSPLTSSNTSPVTMRRSASTSVLLNAAHAASGLLNFGYSFVENFYVKNHEWKEQKYQLGMNGIFEAITTRSFDTLDSNAPANMLLSSLESLIDILTSKESSPRYRYTDFMTSLREVLTSLSFQEARQKMVNDPNDRDPFAVAILEMCNYRFTEVRIFSFCKSTLEMLYKEGRKALGDNEKINFNLLTDRIENEFLLISKAPLQSPKFSTYLSKFKGAANVYSDSHLKSNMPFSLYKLRLSQPDGNTKKTLQVLRLGTPTRQRYSYETCTYFGEAHIIPEFENFIFGLKHLSNQKLMHISLQEDEERVLMSEAERSKALRALHKEYPNNYLLVILSQDSEFYYQEGEYKYFTSTKTFKENFMTIMFSDETTGYFFPSEWKKDPVFRENIKQSLDIVHADIFGNKQSLTKNERLDFIELAYVRIVLYLMKTNNPDLFCFCCKDSVDRAAKCNTLLLYTLLIMIGKEKDEDSLDLLDVYLHMPAMLVKKQKMNVERAKRLLSALQRLENPIVQNNIRKWREFFPIDDSLDLS